MRVSLRNILAALGSPVARRLQAPHVCADAICVRKATHRTSCDGETCLYTYTYIYIDTVYIYILYV